ncbi:MAG TPA: ABATE domain-containing protein [Longimicrobium sp.]|nr:ABATE domain-containing protein [Longimicrobium sp.]
MTLQNPFAEKELAGGHLALDFANTAGVHGDAPESEWLSGYRDLVWWGLRAGVIDDPAAGALLARGDEEADAAASVFARAITLREALYRVFAPVCHGACPENDDLALINAELSRALPHLRVASAGEQAFAWAWEGDGLDRVLWPVVRAAAELLTSGELARIGECEGDNCEWLYLDTSRNRSRRWCVMSDCGNRAKARRHYHRARAGGDG